MTSPDSPGRSIRICSWRRPWWSTTQPSAHVRRARHGTMLRFRPWHSIRIYIFFIWEMLVVETMKHRGWNGFHVFMGISCSKCLHRLDSNRFKSPYVFGPDAESSKIWQDPIKVVYIIMNLLNSCEATLVIHVWQIRKARRCQRHRVVVRCCKYIFDTKICRYLCFFFFLRLSKRCAHLCNVPWFLVTY